MSRPRIYKKAVKKAIYMDTDTLKKGQTMARQERKTFSGWIDSLIRNRWIQPVEKKAA